jgi:DNA polymerase I-like protein with 3'-5' exonuclease and polymerase domains
MEILGIDIETSKSPNHFPWRAGYYLSLISLSYPNGTVNTWTFHHDENKFYDPDKNFREIQREIDRFDVIAAHNAKFELNNLRHRLKFKKIHCTMVGEYLINHQSKKDINLDAMSFKYNLPVKDDRVKKMWDSGMDSHEIPLSVFIPYCEEDARKCRIIAEAQVHKIINQGLKLNFDLQMRWLDMLSAMETRGIKFDVDEAKRIVKHYKKLAYVLEKKVKLLCGPYMQAHELNLSSNDDLSVLLYGGVITRKEKRPVIKTKNIKTRMPYVFTYKDGRKVIKQRWVSHPDTRVVRMVFKDVNYRLKGLGITPLKKTDVAKSTEDKPFYKVDKDTLPFLGLGSRIQKTVVKLLLKLGSVEKVVSTFQGENGTGLLSKIGTDGRLHTNYNQAVTATGRLSSSDPNSQNLPRSGTSPIKRCFIPELDYILNADLSQIELRVPAQLSQDATMMHEIASGIDLHAKATTDIMKVVLNKLNRFYAKTFNFRMIYGGTEYGFHKDPNMPNFGLKKWREVVKAFYAKYRGLERWQQANIKHVIDGDGSLVLPTGRKFVFSLGFQGKYNERQIKNYPVQGLAGGDILPLGAVILWDALRNKGFKSVPILTVHDSVVFDVAEGEQDRLADLCMTVFNNLPKYIKQYWGFDWQVPLTGEVEIGRNYGEQKQIR